MGVTQYAGVVAVLFDDAHGVANDGAGLRGFVGGYDFFGGDRSGEFPAVVGLARQPADQADHQQDEEEFAEHAAEPEPEAFEHGGLGPLSVSVEARAQPSHAGPGFQGRGSTGVSRLSSSGLPSTLRYSISARRSSGCRKRPITPSLRQPSRNSWPWLPLPFIEVSSRKLPG